MADNILQPGADQPDQDPWEAVGNAIHGENGGNMANQFTDSFPFLVRTHRPDLAQGKSADELKAMRSDPDLSREMTIRFAKMNADLLRHSGVPVNVGTLTLSHILGPGTMVNMSQSPKDFNFEDQVGNFPSASRYLKGNPDLQGTSIIDYVKRKQRPDIQRLIEAPENALGSRP